MLSICVMPLKPEMAKRIHFISKHLRSEHKLTNNKIKSSCDCHGKHFMKLKKFIAEASPVI